MFSKNYYLLKDYFGRPGEVFEPQVHLTEALKWIYRAQNINRDGGVSHSYLIGKGWMPSYPETTGYIIPTLINYFKLTKDEQTKERARKMADWLMKIQFDNGAIPSLADGQPVVFDTGQVLFGFLSLYELTRETKYLNAGIKAGDWLVKNMDKDGMWRKNDNYNVRTGWALLELWRFTGEFKYLYRARNYLDWVLSQEYKNGWFRNNCLNDQSRPLLHTIGYTAQGFLESGLILNNRKFIEAARRTADQLIWHVSPEGRIPGRFDCHWNPTVRWCCLTGMAQISIVWRRLHAVTGEDRYMISAKKVNVFLKKTQDLKTGNEGIRGGIKGAYPVNGAYGKYRVLNWATKFFADAMILETYPQYNSPMY